MHVHRVVLFQLGGLMESVVEGKQLGDGIALKFVNEGLVQSVLLFGDIGFVDEVFAKAAAVYW